MDLTIPAEDRPLSIWAVSDGRAGIEAQALALAEAVARARPAEIAVRHVRWPGLVGRLPTSFLMRLPPPRLLPAPFTGMASRAGGDGDGEAWPDLWIAAGRASLPLSVRARRHAFVVQAQDPRWPSAAFDLVIPPEHDGLAGDNVLPILGAPSRMTRERLAAGRAALAERLAGLPRPYVAVAVGGASAAYALSAGHATDLGRQIARAVTAAGGSVLFTTSRRTPPDAADALRRALAGAPGWLWDGSGDNPYAGFLGAADHVLVTEDSVNMAIDAAATGAPVHILSLRAKGPRATAKFRAFHASLAARGASRPFTGALPSWTYAPILEADRAAAEILRRLDARRGLDPAAPGRQPAA